MKPPKWNSFEHRVYREWKGFLPNPCQFVLACSGGLDSMVLLDLAYQLRSPLNLQLRVAHVHHGLSGNKKTDLYRAKAQAFVEKWCGKNGIDFLTEPARQQIGGSEDDFRTLRYDFFNSVLKKGEWLATAHHETDLFETRVLRLLRGVGPQGLQAMQNVDKKSQILRPLLHFSREEIAAYARARKINFVQDPSNASEDYLRNWLRHDWLKSLEKKSPGSVKAWARSLNSLAVAVAEAHTQGDSETKKTRKSSKISRKNLATLSEGKQKTYLARFLRQNGFSGYGQTHIEELLKRLDSVQKRHTFKLLGQTWCLDPQHLALKRD